MEFNEQIRKGEARRLLEWAENNQEIWFEIILAFTEPDMLIGKELKNVMRNLYKNGFYQILILLMYSKNEIITKSLERSLLQFLLHKGNSEALDTMFDLLIDNIN